jgi:hypothetical protein
VAVVSTTRGERGCTADDYRSGVDREAIARRQRRRQVAEALDEEREREAALVARVEEVVVETDGPAIDEQVLPQLEPDDAAVVRELLQEHSPFDDDEGEDLEFLSEDGDAFEEDGVDEELARLEGEIADSQRRQLAYQRYLEALDG